MSMAERVTAVRPLAERREQNRVIRDAERRYVRAMARERFYVQARIFGAGALFGAVLHAVTFYAACGRTIFGGGQ